jgi:hypothetical protein
MTETSEREAGGRVQVVLDQPERQNLLGLLMKDMLEANLASGRHDDRLQGAEGDIQVQAGEMVVTLRLGRGTVTILAGPSKQPRARVKGDMAAFLGVASGGGLVGPLLRGEIGFGGNPFALLKLLPLIKAPPPAAADAKSVTKDEQHDR